MSQSMAAPRLVDAPDGGQLYRRICFFGIIALQFFTVLAFGAVHHWSIAVFQLGSLLLFAVWVFSVLAGGSLRLRRNPLVPPMLAFGGLVVIQYLVKSSAYLPSTRDGLLLLVADFLVFFTLINTVDSFGHKRTLVMTLVFFGVLLAVLALAQDFTNTQRIYWWYQPPRGGWIYGPFINHNHYAGFINMVALFPLAIVLGRGVGRDKAFVMLSLTAVMFASIVFSGSRGGMASFAAQLVLLAVIFGLRGQSRHLAAVLVVGTLLAALAGGVGMVALRSRFGIRPRAMAEGRLMVWRESLTSIRQHFWVGTGWGTFWVVYPRYRSTPSILRWQEAHNDYLQLFLETGLAGFLAMGWFLWRLLAWLVPRLLHEHGPEFGLLLGVTLGIFGMLVHSAVDFNMQIPSNALLFFLLCGLATA